MTDGIPTAKGAEGSYKYGYGNASTVDEFEASIDAMLERARSAHRVVDVPCCCYTNTTAPTKEKPCD